jgi:exopolysaccharide production protein ExoY
MHHEIPFRNRTADCSINRLAELRARARPSLKRAFDLSASIVLLIIVLPVFVLIISAIAFNGEVPFYSHRRVGRGGREFGCLKFKTMRRDADLVLTQLIERDPTARVEWETKRKLWQDPRVTRTGRFLRATSLDELPQLINVLIGDMSLVGPRPVTGEELVKFYGASETAAYFSIRPGLTGLWQVSGRSEVGYDRRVALDTLYAQQISLRSDLVILFRTLGVVVRQRGAW